MKTLLFLLLLAALVGGGWYWYKNGPQMPRLTGSNATSSASPSPSSTQPAPLLPPTIDATWQTYRNKTLNFAFQYPTKGKFAPTFSVKLLPLTSTEVKDGCYMVTDGKTEKKTLGNRNFCRTTSELVATGTSTDTEYWVTTYEKWHAVITFTKKYIDISQTDACGMGNATTSRCQPFDLQGYRTQVEQIIMTFINATSTPSQP